MADPTLTPDRWRTYLLWWRFWGVIGFCLTGFLSFLIISDMEGVPAFCSWHHPCSPVILMLFGPLPLYTWFLSGTASWATARAALHQRRSPMWGMFVGAVLFIPGVILSLYLVANYWWP
ncbi:hypothetical protein [Nocardia yunnanensis]|uniref:hypothetical protein n=1 Tax=Nocardia yunnanensis TaxID=2382165 RepID=UPI0013C3F67B|nr:hypothetical protein [Nocardia yunnanensis]